MIPRKVLEAAFGSPAKIRILRVLFVSPQPLSGRQIGELAQLSHRGAIQALASLVELGAVRQRKVGAAYQYSLSRSNVAVEKIIAPALGAETALLDDLKSTIVERFRRGTVSVILYGSVARGEGKRGSDIDVLAVAKDDRSKTELEERSTDLAPFYRQRYNAILSLHCLTLADLRNRKNLPLLKSIRAEGIVLYGRPLQELLS